MVVILANGNIFIALSKQKISDEILPNFTLLHTKSKLLDYIPKKQTNFALSFTNSF
ncbi:MAG: hypothetical protein P1P88_06835 [Bacteroidales bacterium]|nr:hypothetical protein [Bacteroidales bacterium]